MSENYDMINAKYEIVLMSKRPEGSWGVRNRFPIGLSELEEQKSLKAAQAAAEGWARVEPSTQYKVVKRFNKRINADENNVHYQD